MVKPVRKKTPGLPLTGVRVLDLTAFWSGPFAASLLGSVGAEVIKIESTRRIDPWRGAATASLTGEKTYERSPLFNTVNLDKLGITIDLTTAKGVELFKSLVRISDVVMENYTPRVMKNFGLDYPVLREINPKIIMISMAAHGSTGPWREFPGFAYPMEQMSGIPQLTGEPDRPPRMTDVSPSDPAAAVNGTMAVLTALLFRQRTGRGQYIDLSQVEALTCLVGDAIVEYSMNGRNRNRLGNRHPFWAPQGYYRCKGDNQWVGITVTSDAEWAAFLKVLGSPDWAKDGKYADSTGRWQHQDELDKHIGAWTEHYDHYEVVTMLQAAGIAAGPVLSPPELLQDPHLNARGYFQEVERKLVGTHRYPVPTAAMRFSRCPISIRRPSPMVGEHNEYVFGNLLGMSPPEIQALADEKIIGTTPLGDSISKI
ncbi:MAG: CoA transferase [Dehalococcoidales bacterium]|nr:CoA transferase [Dehalococcoidales bacterium]